MAQRHVSLRIKDMLEAIDAIRAIASQKEFPDRIPRLAFERAFEILSEASRHIPDELKSSEPDIAWRDIAGLGNVLRHDYPFVSEPLLRNAASQHLPALRAALLRLLELTGNG